MEAYRFTEAGTRHQRQGAGNQDALRVEHHGPHCLAFLSDGMGSAGLGAMAADIAVGVGLDMAKRAFVPQPEVDDESGLLAVRTAFSSAYNAIQGAARDGRDLNSLLATFMAVYHNERTGCLHFATAATAASSRSGTTGLCVWPPCRTRVRRRFRRRACSIFPHGRSARSSACALGR